MGWILLLAVGIQVWATEVPRGMANLSWFCQPSFEIQASEDSTLFAEFTPRELRAFLADFVPRHPNAVGFYRTCKADPERKAHVNAIAMSDSRLRQLVEGGRAFHAQYLEWLGNDFSKASGALAVGLFPTRAAWRDLEQLLSPSVAIQEVPVPERVALQRAWQEVEPQVRAIAQRLQVNLSPEGLRAWGEEILHHQVRKQSWRHQQRTDWRRDHGFLPPRIDAWKRTWLARLDQLREQNFYSAYRVATAFRNTRLRIWNAPRDWYWPGSGKVIRHGSLTREGIRSVEKVEAEEAARPLEVGPWSWTRWWLRTAVALAIGANESHLLPTHWALSQRDPFFLVAHPHLRLSGKEGQIDLSPREVQKVFEGWLSPFTVLQTEISRKGRAFVADAMVRDRELLALRIFLAEGKGESVEQLRARLYARYRLEAQAVGSQPATVYHVLRNLPLEGELEAIDAIWVQGLQYHPQYWGKLRDGNFTREELEAGPEARRKAGLFERTVWRVRDWLWRPTEPGKALLIPLTLAATIGGPAAGAVWGMVALVQWRRERSEGPPQQLPFWENDTERIRSSLPERHSVEAFSFHFPKGQPAPRYFDVVTRELLRFQPATEEVQGIARGIEGEGIIRPLGAIKVYVRNATPSKDGLFTIPNPIHPEIVYHLVGIEILAWDFPSGAKDFAREKVRIRFHKPTGLYFGVSDRTAPFGYSVYFQARPALRVKIPREAQRVPAALVRAAGELMEQQGLVAIGRAYQHLAQKHAATGVPLPATEAAFRAFSQYSRWQGRRAAWFPARPYGDVVHLTQGGVLHSTCATCNIVDKRTLRRWLPPSVHVENRMTFLLDRVEPQLIHSVRMPNLHLRTVLRSLSGDWNIDRDVTPTQGAPAIPVLPALQEVPQWQKPNPHWPFLPLLPWWWFTRKNGSKAAPEPDQVFDHVRSLLQRLVESPGFQTLPKRMWVPAVQASPARIFWLAKIFLLLVHSDAPAELSAFLQLYLGDPEALEGVGESNLLQWVRVEALREQKKLALWRGERAEDALFLPILQELVEYLASGRWEGAALRPGSCTTSLARSL